MKKIEQVAAMLLKKGIAFEYNPKFLQIKDNSFYIFQSASYHRNTKELILMDMGFHKVDIEQAVRETKSFDPNWNNIKY